MARKKIQGITIEIGGDTSKLQDALKGVENKLKDTQYALKDVNKLLKLDPGNVELLTQKQKLLNDAYEASKDKLKVLEEAAEEAYGNMVSGAEGGKEEYDALQREIIETKQEMERLTDQMKEFGNVSAQQLAAAGEKLKGVGDKITGVGTGLTKYVTGPIVAAGAASVAAFNEVDEGLDIIVKKTGATGDALEDMEERAKNLATSIPTDFRTAGEAVGEVNTRFGLTGDALEKLSGKFIRFADLNGTSVTASIDTVQAAMAAFNIKTENAGYVLDVLNKAAQDTGTDVGKLASDLTANAAALREMGFGINSATGFLASLNKNGVDSSAVLTGLKKALQNATKDGKSMETALAELTGKIRGAKSETKAMQIATDLFGAKAAPAMVKAIREGRISFEQLANSVEGYGDSVENTFEATLDPIDQLKTVLNELKIIGTDLVNAAAPMIKAFAEALKNMVSNLRAAWEGLSPQMQQTVVKLAAIAAAVGPVLVVVGKLTSAVGSLLTFGPKILEAVSAVQGALSALWAVLAANPIVLVIAAVAALVAALIYLWNNCEGFREFWINLGNKIKEIASTVAQALSETWKRAVATATALWTGLEDTLGGIWDGIKSKAESVWNGITGFIRSAIEKIKSFFNFHWELPKLKLPHFSITGKFSLNPPQVPHLSVEWYRKAMADGMILTSPTILPAANGSLRGFGDAGAEAVVGVDSLRGMIASAVAGAANSGAPRMMTLILELDRAEVARKTFELYNEESRRMGVALSPR